METRPARNDSARERRGQQDQALIGRQEKEGEKKGTELSNAQQKDFLER